MWHCAGDNAPASLPEDMPTTCTDPIPTPLFSGSTPANSETLASGLRDPLSKTRPWASRRTSTRRNRAATNASSAESHEPAQRSINSSATGAFPMHAPAPGSSHATPTQAGGVSSKSSCPHSMWGHLVRMPCLLLLGLCTLLRLPYSMPCEN